MIKMVIFATVTLLGCQYDVLIIFPAKAFARDYGITGVRLSVCFSVTTKTWTDLDEIFWEGS